MSSAGSFAGGLVAGVAGTAAAALALDQGKKMLDGGKRRTPKYVSTRGFAGADGNGIDFETAVLMGLGTDGGLMVPTEFPQVSEEMLDSWYGLDFQSLAFEVMSLYIPRDQVSAEQLKDIVTRSYGTFRHEQVTPVVRSGPEGKGPKILELFHGPTFAFKDVALQFLGNLFELFVSQKNEKVTILGATSGDTGSSAIYGLRGKQGVEVFILFPEGRVSPIQERQMTTVPDENIHCIAIEGTFDDAQAIVKSMFNDEKVKAEMSLGAVNSINFARILAQIVYYFYAYLTVVPKRPKWKQGTKRSKISFSVPTGNFGDILAGYYAKRMGLPVDQLVVATNENDILHRFFSKGEYFKPSGVSPTLSPSMDICVSSNFERFLYHMADDNAEKLNNWMKTFESTGKLEASPELLKRAQGEMLSARLSQPEILDTIRENFEAHNYLLDPHSAIGVGGATQLQKDGKLHEAVPMVCLACAHWGKFSKAVGSAIGEDKLKQCPFPKELEKLKSLPTRKQVMPATMDAVKEHMRSILK
mmetsp:Transcript_20724/g.33766  ORF Transcript_20724/g.33766 Transcript_20724/m.33766 type:complete len:529 (-) Transcript_20724:33-1619(-)